MRSIVSVVPMATERVRRCLPLWPRTFRALTAPWLVASGLLVSTAAAQEATRISPATPPDNTATEYAWSSADMAEEDRIEDADKPFVREGFIVLPFVGLTFAGSGKIKTEG